MKTALLLIDIQKGFLSERFGKRNNPYAEERISKILSHFRQNNHPVIHVVHRSLSPEGAFYKDNNREVMVGFEPQGNEPVFEKQVNSAFIGTSLEDYLRENEIQQLVIAGFTLPHCVSTTTRMAGNLGFDVTLLSDATVTFALPDLSGKLVGPEELHRINLISLQGEFATVLTVDDYLKRVEIF